MSHILTADEQQFKVIKEALDLYSRVCTGQLVEVAQYLPIKYDHPEAWDALNNLVHRLDIRNHGVSHHDVGDNARIAFDIQQVIANRLAKLNSPKINGMTIYFSDPFKTSQLPFPIFK